MEQIQLAVKEASHGSPAKIAGCGGRSATGVGGTHTNADSASTFAIRERLLLSCRPDMPGDLPS
jgi:hypothetical protein